MANIDFTDRQILEELIEDAVECAAEFGEDHKVAAWVKTLDGLEYISNFDYIVEEDPIDPSECKEGETIRVMRIGDVLVRLMDMQDMI